MGNTNTKFIEQSIKKPNPLLFKQNNQENLNMIFDFARPTVAGFSYLHFFQSQWWANITEHLKRNPTASDVVSFTLQNHKKEPTLLVKQKIKPDIRSDTKLIMVETGNLPEKPVKKQLNWGDDIDETEEEYQIRLRQYEGELEKWWEVEAFFFYLGIEEDMHNYKFV